MNNDRYKIPTTIAAFNRNMFVNLAHSIRRKNWRGLLDVLSIGYNRTWFEIAKSFFKKFLMRGGVYHLWGHSWQIEQNNQWNEIEKLFAFISQKSGNEYLTNNEILKKIMQNTSKPNI
jgi:hypothetical protein